jgi:hypothetical protein
VQINGQIVDQLQRKLLQQASDGEQVALVRIISDDNYSDYSNGTATAAVNTTSQATNKPRLISKVILMIKRQQLELVRGAAHGPQRTDLPARSTALLGPAGGIQLAFHLTQDARTTAARHQTVVAD